MEFFNTSSWSSNKINFYVLEKLIPLLNENYIRIYALISWLKPINKETNEILNDRKSIKQCLRSKEFFLVRNYIKKYKLVYSLKKEEILDLKKNFSPFIDCLDMGGIFDNFILSSKQLVCILCNHSFNSIYQITNEREKNEENYDKIYKNIFSSNTVSEGVNYFSKNSFQNIALFPK